MESTGSPGKIQVSAATEKLLTAAGKTWTRRREEEVQAKGKGTMQTYWLEIRSRSDGSNPDATSIENSQALDLFSNHDGKNGNHNPKKPQEQSQPVARTRSDGDLRLLDPTVPIVEGRRHSVHGTSLPDPTVPSVEGRRHSLLDPTFPSVEGRRHSVHGAQLYRPSAM
jgi:Adenylate and Guanylate cyclase catalytic domain